MSNTSRLSRAIYYTITIKIVPINIVTINMSKIKRALIDILSKEKILFWNHSVPGDVCQDLEMANKSRVPSGNPNFRGRKGKIYIDWIYVFCYYRDYSYIDILHNDQYMEGGANLYCDTIIIIIIVIIITFIIISQATILSLCAEADSRVKEVWTDVKSISLVLFQCFRSRTFFGHCYPLSYSHDNGD